MYVEVTIDVNFQKLTGVVSCSLLFAGSQLHKVVPMLSSSYNLCINRKTNFKIEKIDNDLLVQM